MSSDVRNMRSSHSNASRLWFSIRLTHMFSDTGTLRSSYSNRFSEWRILFVPLKWWQGKKEYNSHVYITPHKTSGTIISNNDIVCYCSIIIIKLSILVASKNTLIAFSQRATDWWWYDSRKLHRLPTAILKYSINNRHTFPNNQWHLRTIFFESTQHKTRC